MKADLTGTVRMAGEAQSTIHVELHLEDEELRIVSQQGELGRWPLSDIGVAAKLDGFHLRIEGEELIIATSDDAQFALALGIRSSSSPRLNRLLAGARDAGFAPDAGPIAPPPPAWRPDYPSVRAPDRADPASPVALGLLGAAAAQALAGAVVLASNSTVGILGVIPAGPAWILAAVLVAVGGFILVRNVRNGRNLVTAGVVVGLLTMAGSLTDIGEPAFSWISDGVVLGGAGTILAGLLLLVDSLNRQN